MPPKIKFDREVIVEATFDISKEEDFAGITARRVVKHLYWSVAPIFVDSSKK